MLSWDSRRRGAAAVHPELSCRTQVPTKTPGSLRLLSLNAAHGRSTAAHQALLPRDRTERNVADIGRLVKDVGPEVVALQEADGPSAWSGNFDHVAALADFTEMSSHYRGDHNPFGFGRFNLESGTALLSRLGLESTQSHRFAANWRDTKGFVVAAVRVPQWDGREIDVVSVHLDFLRPQVRRRQILDMVHALIHRRRPLVILGDLNCCWHQEPESLELFEDTLGLRPFEPHRLVPTFPSHRPRRRLDWVLVSSELDFVSHHTLSAPLSDHLVVVADLELRS